MPYFLLHVFCQHIYSLGFVLKAMVVIKFGLLWEPVLKSATDSNQQILPILQWNTRDSSHQELPALLMAAMIKIVVVGCIGCVD